MTGRPGWAVDAADAAGESRRMKVTYYLEVLSSWCRWVEPVWVELKTRYAGRAEFDWKIALMS